MMVELGAGSCAMCGKWLEITVAKDEMRRDGHVVAQAQAMAPVDAVAKRLVDSVFE